MGLSNTLASGLMMVSMLQIFILFSGVSLERISELYGEIYSIGSVDMLALGDWCSITGVGMADTASGAVVYINVSNTGSAQWWDYRRVHAILYIVLSNGARESHMVPVASLPYTVYGDSVNPGIVDPGEVLGIAYSLARVYSNNISVVRAVFSTQYGGVCIG